MYGPNNAAACNDTETDSGPMQAVLDSAAPEEDNQLMCEDDDEIEPETARKRPTKMIMTL